MTDGWLDKWKEKHPEKFATEDRIFSHIHRGDRILAAIDSDTAGIILTNSILPSPNIISKAESRGIPLLLSHSDTFRVAKQIDDAEALLTRDNAASIETLKELVASRIDLSGF